MKRMMSRKSHSWWWDSHVSPKNSKWLSENLEQMDCLVNEMLKLIEEDGDSFSKKAQMYYQRRPELISHVEAFYRMYRALAERYDNATGELRKAFPLELRSQGSGSGSDFGTEPVSPSPDHTPERKLNLPKPHGGATGLDIFLGSGASSEFSRKEYDDSSSSSSKSGSDDEDGIGKVGDADDNLLVLNGRIIQLENELHELREKLQEYEKGSNGHINNLDIPNGLASNNESEASNEKHPNSEDHTFVLEAELSNHKDEIMSLKEAMVATAEQFEIEISNKDHAIEEYKTQLDEALKKFKQEKWTLEAELKSSIDSLKVEAKQLSEEKSLLEIRISEQEQMTRELRVMLAESSEKLLHEKAVLEEKVCSLVNSENNYAAKLHALEDRVSELEAEKTEACNESAKRIAELNQNLDGYKLRADMLVSEKDELNARIGKFVDDAKSRDDNYRCMADHLHQLHLEHVKLIKEIEDSRKTSAELMNRVGELEEEVVKQRVLISDGAEGKREAIRQLCFSLEHYRDGYKQLRQVLQGQNKRHAIMAI